MVRLKEAERQTWCVGDASKSVLFAEPNRRQVSWVNLFIVNCCIVAANEMLLRSEVVEPHFNISMIITFIDES